MKLLTKRRLGASAAATVSSRGCGLHLGCHSLSHSKWSNAACHVLQVRHECPQTLKPWNMLLSLEKRWTGNVNKRDNLLNLNTKQWNPQNLLNYIGKIQIDTVHTIIYLCLELSGYDLLLYSMHQILPLLLATNSIQDFKIIQATKFIQVLCAVK